jgi:hypothetical protein
MARNIARAAPTPIDLSAGCHQVGSDKNRLTLSRLSNGSDGTRFERRPCFLSFKAILGRPECHLIGIVLALVDCFFRTNNSAIRQTLFQSCLQNLLRPEARKVYCPRSGATCPSPKCDPADGMGLFHRPGSSCSSLRFGIGCSLTVRSERSKPSIFSSPWMRGAPHVEFSATMRKISSRNSLLTHFCRREPDAARAKPNTA